ncbi:ACP S-malonyltransferase [Paraburkholderia sp. BCC1885]|uniref:ACP S-malonyltransferase n=1 Tax=Paraburkholderia sp. BCC1885 TaxID=2562669 RepID=UPI00118369E0|nr:acyltransferase domain-containing protein [Paraburkholderia sp. BCC1885]
MLALLCSGQGRQSAGMFNLFADSPEAEPVFAEANDVFGSDIRDVVRNANNTALHQNRTSQLLNVTRALVAHQCIASALPPNLIVAGYSVGEMAAWGIAGVWSIADTLRLTATRAELMSNASGSDDALGFVRGLDYNTVSGMATQKGCAIAIINPGNLFIVGGARGMLARLCDDALRAGAKHSGLLAVHVASHTPRLDAAVGPFERALRAIEAKKITASCKLLGAACAERIFRPAEAIQGLAAQLARPIDWNTVLVALVEQGVDRILELGPGSALADMVRGEYPTVSVRALDDFCSIEGAKAWLGN